MPLARSRSVGHSSVGIRERVAVLRRPESFPDTRAVLCLTWTCCNSVRKRGPSRQGSAKSGRTEVLRQPGACRFHAVAKGCSRSSGSLHDTVWARSHRGVVRKAEKVAPEVWAQSFWVPGRLCVSFFTEPVVESQSLRVKWVGKYLGLATADLFPVASWYHRASGAQGVSVHGSAEFPRNGRSRRDCRPFDRS